VSLKEYRIGKYPVTKAQYRRFVEDGGYTGKWRECWTEAGWRFLGYHQIEMPTDWEDPELKPDNYPVAGVSWYEAIAYCNRLTKTDEQGRTFRLPTEAEWEKAASWDEQKKEKREYPWGNEFDKDKANTAEGDFEGTTDVGRFPGGASPYGALDMAGNVWEWCSSFEYYRYKETGPEEDGSNSIEGTERRALRGGAFSERATRSAERYGLNPHLHFPDIGFRVAESAPPTGGSQD
jgi:formylglycine-generating enzyme required for sulfatase activity